MASSRRPKMSLPPELVAIDDAWGEDEQPTIARPSRVPTAPARIKMPSEAPTAPGFQFDAPKFELDLTEDERLAALQERVTSIPEIPLDDYARRAMRSDSEAARSTDAPAPRAFNSDPPGERPSGIPTGVPDSDIPTAPPPEERSWRGDGHLPPLSNVGITLHELDSHAAPPPLSEPRRDRPTYPGRFSSTPPDAKSAEQKMKERFAVGDFSGALDVAEKLLKSQPHDRDAQALAKKCREVLVDMYSSRIAGLHRVPEIIMGPDQIRWLSLDHRSGFLLSMIDGISSVDDLLDVSGMQRLDALRILCDLLEQKVISIN